MFYLETNKRFRSTDIDDRAPSLRFQFWQDLHEVHKQGGPQEPCLVFQHQKKDEDLIRAVSFQIFYLPFF